MVVTKRPISLIGSFVKEVAMQTAGENIPYVSEIGPDIKHHNLKFIMAPSDFNKAAVIFFGHKYKKHPDIFFFCYRSIAARKV